MYNLIADLIAKILNGETIELPYKLSNELEHFLTGDALILNIPLADIFDKIEIKSPIDVFQQDSIAGVMANITSLIEDHGKLPESIETFIKKGDLPEDLIISVNLPFVKTSEVQEVTKEPIDEFMEKFPDLIEFKGPIVDDDLINLISPAIEKLVDLVKLMVSPSKTHLISINREFFDKLIEANNVAIGDKTLENHSQLVFVYEQAKTFNIIINEEQENACIIYNLL